MQLMTQTEFARHRGVGKPAVSNWKKKGWLVFAEGPGGKPLVDVARTDAKLNANIDPMRGRPATGAAATSGGDAPVLPLGEGAAPAPPAAATAASATEANIADERLQELRERRHGHALKNAQLAGGLVPLVEAEQRVAEVGRAARERMHAWFRGVAERIAAEKDVRAIMVLGEEGIDQVFAELAAAAARGDFAEDEDDDLTEEEAAELEAAGELESEA